MAILTCNQKILFFHILQIKIKLYFSNEAGQSPLWLGDDLEFWPEKGAKEKVKFVQIAALHNELVAVSDKGHLYQWKWSDITPHR